MEKTRMQSKNIRAAILKNLRTDRTNTTEKAQKIADRRPRSVTLYG
jgi:hypothetical protein